MPCFAEDSGFGSYLFLGRLGKGIRLYRQEGSHDCSCRCVEIAMTRDEGD